MRIQDWINTFDTFVGKFDSEGNGITFNNAPIKAGGLTMSDVVGNYFPDTKWWMHSETERARIVECFEKAKAGISSRIETNFRSADGTPVPIIFNCQPVIGNDGEIKYITAEGKIIIEEINLRNTLQEEKENLENRVRERTSDLVAVNKKLRKEIAERMQAEEEREQLHKQVQHRLKELTAIYQASQRLQQLFTSEALSQEIISILEKILDYQNIAVVLIDQDTGQLVPFALSDQERGPAFIEADKEYVASHDIRLGVGITGRVAQTGESICVADVRKDPRYYSMRENIRSELCVPLIESDKIIGVVNIESPKTNAYTENDQYVLETIAAQIATTIQNASMYDRIKEYTSELEQHIIERKQAEEELKKSYDQLRSLATHLQSIREEERTQIAREIHDELGQVLTALKMDLSWLNKKLPKEQKSLSDKTVTMSNLIDSTINTVKRIAMELRPGLLDDLGLAAAIEWQAEEFQNRTGIECKVTINPENIIIDQNRSTAIFRVFQETMTNVARHAKATKVRVSLKEKSAKVFLQVKDNGRGITKEEISKPGSFGILGIQERIYPWGGDVDISGIKGKGTTVTVNVPLGNERQFND